ncbi:toll/interleukin-1 receptor domain-containing protein [Nitrosomonas communis]|uniref:toll/interleukin-1 receptor domain-containing protein n=1 Tax=Nitrosomonas communis TaxID=44574 RepID=UPI003D2BFF6A
MEPSVVDKPFLYDAFISYSGSSNRNGGATFDRQVAERLIKELENYRVPRSLTRNLSQIPNIQHRLKKVFLDREEMQASSSLHNSLVDALQQSRFLIVICSPRAQRSRWVNEEVALFRRFRGKEYILTILIEGEPEESFPLDLLGGQPRGESSDNGDAADLASLPLASDIRAPNRQQSLRLLKREKLRLLASILGCRFDDLYRREHQRFIKRVTIAVGLLSLICLLLISLSVFLWLAEGRAQRNYDHALEAGAKILPLVLLPHEDLPAKEVHLTNAITIMESLCDEDKRNARCLENLYTLKSALFSVQQMLGKSIEAEGNFKASKELIAPIALQRLREWDPYRIPKHDDLFSELPDTQNIKRLYNLLSIWDQPMGAPPRVEDAVTYAEYASEYLLALNTSTLEGKKEAHRVLSKTLQMFQQVDDRANLNETHELLIDELTVALKKISSE